MANIYEKLGRSAAAEDPRFQKLLSQLAQPLARYESRDFLDLIEQVSDLRRFIEEIGPAKPSVPDAALFACEAARHLGDRRAAQRVLVVLANYKAAADEFRALMNAEVDKSSAAASGSSTGGSSRTRKPDQR